MSLIGCFVSAWLFFTGSELILILFGDQWHPAIVPFKILALSVWFQLSTNTFGPIYLSIGKTKLMFKGVICSTTIIVSSIIIGCVMGSIVNVAICVSIAYVLNYFVSFFIMVRYGFHESLRKFFYTFRHEVLFFAVLMGLAFIPLDIPNIVVSFIVKTAIMGGAYLIMLVVSKQHRYFLSLIHK